MPAVTLPLVEQRDYGAKRQDQLERNYEIIKNLRPELVSDVLKKQFGDRDDRIERIASEIENESLTRDIVNRVMKE